MGLELVRTAHPTCCHPRGWAMNKLIQAIFDGLPSLAATLRAIAAQR
jgi:hypothetical protein